MKWVVRLIFFLIIVLILSAGCLDASKSGYPENRTMPNVTFSVFGQPTHTPPTPDTTEMVIYPEFPRVSDD